MHNRRHQHPEQGQGLVEYALIVVLVAILVVGAGYLIGLAAQRIYGIVAGALGASHKTTGARVIEITTAECIADPHQGDSGLTGLWVTGITTEDVMKLTGSTNQAVGTGIGGEASPVEPNGVNG